MWSSGIAQVGQWVQTGQQPEMLRRFLDNVQESSIMQVIRREILEPLRSLYPEQYRTAEEIVEKMKDNLKQDIEKGREYLLKFPTTNVFVTKIVNTINNVSIDIVLLV